MHIALSTKHWKSPKNARNALRLSMSQGYSWVLVSWSVGIPVGIRPMGHKYLFAEILTDLGQALSVEKIFKNIKYI